MNFLHTSRKFNFTISALILSFTPGIKISATHFQELGQPYVQTIHPGQYSYVNQYNSVTQDDDGFLYLGTQNGILRYDGTYWYDLKIQGEYILSRSNKGIFGYNRKVFGYLVKAQDGTHELSGINLDESSFLKKGDSIRCVLSSGDKLYILTSSGLFSWESKIQQKIDLPFQADGIFRSSSGIFIYDSQEGIYLYKDGRLSLMTGADDLPEGKITALVATDTIQIMVDGTNGKVFFYETAGSRKVSAHLDSILASDHFTSLIGLSSGHLAWGTRTGGVIITDQNGSVIKRISHREGLSSDHVKSFFIDATDHLWVVHPQTLSRIEFPSAFSHFGTANGLEGTINDLARFKGLLYAATNQGLYCLVHTTGTSGITGQSHFRRVSGIIGECRQISGSNESLYILTNEGMVSLSGNGLVTHIAGSINTIHYSARTNLLLAGSDHAFLIFKGDRNIYRDTTITRIYEIGESDGGQLWLASLHQDLYRSEDFFDGEEDIGFVKYSSTNMAGGSEAYINLVTVRGQIYFSGLAGVYRYQIQKDRFIRDSLFNLPGLKGRFQVSQISRDVLQQYWVNVHFPEESRSEVFISNGKNDKGLVLNNIPYRRANRLHINCFYPEEGPVMWMGSEEGILRYDPAFASPHKPVFHTHIVNVIFNGDSVYDHDFIASDAFLERHRNGRVDIPFAWNRIGFLLTSTDFSTEINPMFQYRLTGLQDSWSAWTEDPMIEFRELNRGRYELHVRSQDIYGSVSESERFSFRINPPLYLSWYAIVFYTLLFILLIIGYQKWRSIQHDRERFRLEEIIQERTEALIKEKEKTENLLANILPKKTADELKSKGKVTSSKFKLVTVLFADIEGFTKIAEQMNPDKLIDELDRFYFHFDSVVEKYNIEKIKTIGDAYMAAGGIPVKNRTNPVDVILAALEMQQFMKGLKHDMADIWDLRIGIHTGSVIAGVVGQKKFSYDIWGDTVNTASRMESSGKIGRVNISASTYELVKDFFDCEFRGKMPVKYKGDIAMYFVNGIKPGLREEDGITPNQKFLIQIQFLRLLDLEDHIMDRLVRELSEKLLYHNVQHTGRVYRQVEILGQGEGVSQEEMLLLKSAALLHDIGHIDTFDGHEERSVEIAQELLPLYRFKEKQIDVICNLILSTKLPPGPVSLLEKIICDANLDHLGRSDFLIQSDRLFQEYLMNKKVINKKDWNALQIKLLENHEFYTETARQLREVSREQQIENIRQFS
jgi:adenylate cyclase